MWAVRLRFKSLGILHHGMPNHVAKNRIGTVR